jgi:hypothetical protein
MLENSVAEWMAPLKKSSAPSSYLCYLRTDNCIQQAYHGSVSWGRQTLSKPSQIIYYIVS